MGVKLDSSITKLDIRNSLNSPTLSVDTEGNGRDLRHDKDAATAGISASWREASVFVESRYYPFKHMVGPNLPIRQLDEIRQVIEEHPRLVFHNAKHDILALRQMGIDVLNKPWYDTMLMGHWLNENMLNKGLDSMSRLYGGKPKAKPEIMAKIIKTMGWEYVPSSIMAEYSANDAQITLELFEKLLPDFISEFPDEELWDMERDFLRLVIKMEGYGVRVNQELCKEELARGQSRMEAIQKELGGLNPNSPQVLELLLIDMLELEPYKFTSSGRISFDREAMEHYEEELEGREDRTAKLVLEYRGWLKACSAYYGSYLKQLSAEGNLHPNFKLHGTRTGRLSCEKPNLQQIPRAGTKTWNINSKRAIVSRPGYTLWEFDYANLEFRLGAVYSNEPNMVEPLQQGFKPFDAMAELLFGVDWTQEQRQLCKTFTYMTSYGAGIAKIARIMKLNQDEAEKLKADFFNAYPGLKNVTRLASRKAEARGYALLWSGRRRHFDDGSGAHKAFNAVIQGGAAELVKRTMLALDKVIDWDNCKMLLQVHDSVVFEIREGTESHWLPIIQMTMESVASLHPKFGMVPFPTDSKVWGK